MVLGNVECLSLGDHLASCWPRGWSFSRGAAGSSCATEEKLRRAPTIDERVRATVEKSSKMKQKHAECSSPLPRRPGGSDPFREGSIRSALRDEQCQNNPKTRISRPNLLRSGASSPPIHRRYVVHFPHEPELSEATDFFFRSHRRTRASSGAGNVAFTVREIGGANSTAPCRLHLLLSTP